MTNFEIVDCLDCGKCCTSKSLENISVYATDEEWEAIPNRYKPILKWQKNHMGFKPHDDGFCCSALSGEVGKKISCDIYEIRPDSCRKFEVGSERCLEARKFETTGFLQ